MPQSKSDSAVPSTGPAWMLAWFLPAVVAVHAAPAWAGTLLSRTTTQSVESAEIDLRPVSVSLFEPLDFPDALPPEPEAPTVQQESQELIDLRAPLLTDWGEILQLQEPSWLNSVIDDHALLRRNSRDSVEWLGRGGSGFGMTSLGFKVQTQTEDGPVWLSMFFESHFLDGPGQPDVAARLYDLGVEFNFARHLDDVWGVHCQLTPLFATDFHNNSSDAFRLAASAMLTCQIDPVTTGVAGLIYLDRPDLDFLPVAGIRWMVTDTLQVDLLVPRPRIAWRIDDEQQDQVWVYLAGEVGGGSWAIEREFQRRDRMGYSDLRLLLGLESKLPGGERQVLEAGYVFDRELHYDRFGNGSRPGGTAVIRWGQLY